MRAKDNPFASDQIEALEYRFQEGNWDEVLARLAVHSYRSCVLGPEGSGKTTFIQCLARKLQLMDIYVSLHTFSPNYGGDPADLIQAIKSQANAQTVVILDGADHLPRHLWALLQWQSKRWKGLVVTSHTKELLPVLWHCKTDEQLFSSLVKELTVDSSLQAEANVAFHSAQGNVRSAFLSLYDSAASLELPQ